MALASAGNAQILPHGFVVETLAPNQVGPTSLDFLPDGRVIFVEQNTGAVKVLCPTGGNAVGTLGQVPGLVVSYSRGLLGVAVDPQWPSRPFLYCYHTNAAAADLRISRFTVTGDLGTPTSTNLQLGPAYTVLAGLPDVTPLHESGCLRFSPDGTLLCSVGDDTNACAAQNVTVGNGKLLRLKVDLLPFNGSGPPTLALITPPGNPFPGSAGLAPLVYATGMRNPFRFHVDSANGAIFVSDVGELQKDEINRIDAPGYNLGWPWLEGDVPYTTCSGSAPSNTLVPIAMQPVGPQFTALISLGVYRTPNNPTWPFGASYEGDYFYTEHFSGRIWRLRDQGGWWDIAPPVPGQFSSTLWGSGVFWIVDAKFGRDGALYLCERVSSTSGSVRRIRPTGATAVAFGQGCGGSFGTATMAPAAGSLPTLGSTFQTVVSNLPLPPAGLSVGVMGFSKTTWGGIPLPLDLGVLGMPGCTAWAAPEGLAVLPRVGTTATFTLPLPNGTGLIGQDFYLQTLVLDIGWNPFGGVVTNAVECVIR